MRSANSSPNGTCERQTKEDKNAARLRYTRLSSRQCSQQPGAGAPEGSSSLMGWHVHCLVRLFTLSMLIWSSKMKKQLTASHQRLLIICMFERASQKR
jgi:hypothetical protein